MKQHRDEFSIRVMCRVFKLHPSGFYAWLIKPFSDRAIEDQRLLKLIKGFYIVSGATYGSPWIHHDLRESGEICSVHRVAKIMRNNKLKAQIGYKRCYIKGGKAATVAENILEQNFNPTNPNERWVSDITYVRTYEGFLYVAMVLDLFSRYIVGWSMDKNIDQYLVINVLLMAVCARHYKNKTRNESFRIFFTSNLLIGSLIKLPILSYNMSLLRHPIAIFKAKSSRKLDIPNIVSSVGINL